MAEEAPSSPGGSGGSGSHEKGGAGGDRSPRSPSSNVLGLDEDLFLPIANVRRIIKKGKVLPVDAKIAKDAKQTYLECVSVFISFITSEASDKCRKDKRQTLNGDDLIWAMNRLGFQDYVNPLKAYLNKYRQVTQIEGEYLRSIKDHDVRSVRKDAAT
ncbi:hypothetical protein Lser_V15G28492 [Lactuca serriola]